MKSMYSRGFIFSTISATRLVGRLSRSSRISSRNRVLIHYQPRYFKHRRDKWKRDSAREHYVRLSNGTCNVKRRVPAMAGVGSE